MFLLLCRRFPFHLVAADGEQGYARIAFPKDGSVLDACVFRVSALRRSYHKAVACCILSESTRMIQSHCHSKRLGSLRTLASLNRKYLLAVFYLPILFCLRGGPSPNLDPSGPFASNTALCPCIILRPSLPAASPFWMQSLLTLCQLLQWLLPPAPAARGPSTS